MKQVDKAGAKYWNENWFVVEKPSLFSEDNKSLDNYVNIRFHEFFKALFGKRKQFKILEIG